MKVRRIAESAIALSVSYDSTAECVSEIRRRYRQLLHAHLPGIVSVRPGLDTLVVEHEPGLNPRPVIDLLSTHEPDVEPDDTAGPVRIPVCFNGKDLPAAAEACRMSIRETIQCFLAGKYSVWMIGFMPGFPYLGELDPRLRLPRKPVPDRLIPAGSVAIAEEYCGIYPFESPGGWHVIGTTSVTLTDYSRQPPCLLSYGQSVEFYVENADIPLPDRLY